MVGTWKFQLLLHSTEPSASSQPLGYICKAQEEEQMPEHFHSGVTPGED